LLLLLTGNKLAQYLILGIYMANARPLTTRCTVCRETILIRRDAAAVGQSVRCPHCGTPALITMLIDAARALPSE
jgi:hypothetical protein